MKNTDIPITKKYSPEIYKNSAQSLCQDCAYFERDCSAVPLVMFKGRDSKIFTTSCRDWRNNIPDLTDDVEYQRFLEKQKRDMRKRNEMGEIPIAIIGELT